MSEAGLPQAFRVDCLCRFAVCYVDLPMTNGGWSGEYRDGIRRVTVQTAASPFTDTGRGLPWFTVK